MMIHFLRPFYLFLLIPVMLYLIWLFIVYRQNNPWKNVCDAHLLVRLAQPMPRTRKIFSNLILVFLFSIGVIALAGPAIKKARVPVYNDANSLMLILDLSHAMLATDLKPDRLTRAKFKIRDLIQSSPNTQMGLVVFTEEAFVVSPLSQDANTLIAMLDELTPDIMPIAGSDSGQGLTQGLTLLQQAQINKSNFLLLTASEPTPSSWKVAKKLSQSGHHLNVLALFETNEITKPTEQKLQQLAATGNGSFYLFTPNAMDIKNILNRLEGKQAIKDKKIENIYLWEDIGPWLCLLLIPIALLILMREGQ